MIHADASDLSIGSCTAIKKHASAQFYSEIVELMLKMERVTIKIRN